MYTNQLRIIVNGEYFSHYMIVPTEAVIIKPLAILFRATLRAALPQQLYGQGPLPFDTHASCRYNGTSAARWYAGDCPSHPRLGKGGDDHVSSDGLAANQTVRQPPL